MLNLQNSGVALCRETDRRDDDQHCTAVTQRIPSMEFAMSVKTRGTQMFFVNADGDLVQLGCPKGINGLGGAASQVPETCLDSDEMEYSPGMPAPAALSVDLDYDRSKVSHVEIEDLYDQQITTTFVIGMSDGAKTIIPTIDSAGVITFPTTRTFVEFRAYVADIPLNFALNANVGGTVSIQRTGKRTWHDKT